MPPAAVGRWLVRPAPRPAASLRLFCFPHAGASASAYRQWPGEIDSIVDVWAVQLPGRENRLTEPPLDSCATVVEALIPVIAEVADRPFAFFGHSMGALIAFEVGRGLRRRGGLQPSCIFVSAHRAPHLPRVGPARASLPDSELISEIRRLGGAPDEVVVMDELMQLVLPALRADFTIADSYQHTWQPPLACAISAIAAIDDEDVGVEDVREWCQHTKGPFVFRAVPGGHFYLRDDLPAVTGLVMEDLLKIADEHR